METEERVLTLKEKERIKVIYENKYGKLSSGHYLSIWLSYVENVMVRHLLEEHEWTKDTLIRQVNLGNAYEVLKYYQAIIPQQ